VVHRMGALQSPRGLPYRLLKSALLPLGILNVVQ
jgi:hypothetical protein